MTEEVTGTYAIDEAQGRRQVLRLGSGTIGAKNSVPMETDECRK